MRNLPTMLAVFCLSVPAFSVSANPDVELADWDYAPLTEDWSLDNIVGGEVIASNGIQVGYVNDIIFDESGLLDTVVVQQKDDSGDWTFREVAWANVDFDPALNQIELKVDSETFNGFDELEIADFSGPEELEASNLLGMDVNADGMAPYGEVEDLLVTEGANSLSAIVVESDGLGSFHYAVPADIEDLDGDSVVLDLPYTVEDIEALDWFVWEDMA